MQYKLSDSEWSAIRRVAGADRIDSRRTPLVSVSWCLGGRGYIASEVIRLSNRPAITSDKSCARMTWSTANKTARAACGCSWYPKQSNRANAASIVAVGAQHVGITTLSAEVQGSARQIANL